MTLHDQQHLHDGADGSGAIPGSLGGVFNVPMTPCVMTGSMAQIVVLTINRAHWWRVVGISGPTTITKIGVNLSAFNASAIDVGIYAATGSSAINSKPGSKIVVASVTPGASGYKECALGGSYVVNPGDWFYLDVANAGNTFAGIATAISGFPAGDSTNQLSAIGAIQLSVNQGSSPSSGASAANFANTGQVGMWGVP